MTLDHTKRFTKRADFYARFRPGYPPGVVKIISKSLGLTSNDTVADIGSGTGLLSKLFLKSGYKVYGVEPNDKMRGHAEKGLSHFRNFISINGTAEATTLAPRSVDLITAGQALHWFAPARSRKEFSRISRPGGGFCVVYNKRKSSDRFSRVYAKIIRRYGRDRAKVPDIGGRLVSRYFDRGRFASFSLANEQTLDFEGLRGRLVSASYMPTPRDKDYRTFEKEVRDVFDTYSVGGCVRIPYDTEILVGKVNQLT